MVVLTLVGRIPNWEADASHCLTRSISVSPSFPRQLRRKETPAKEVLVRTRHNRPQKITSSSFPHIRHSTCWALPAFPAAPGPTVSKFSRERGQLSLTKKPHVAEPRVGTLRGLHLFPSHAAMEQQARSSGLYSSVGQGHPPMRKQRSSLPGAPELKWCPRRPGTRTL